MTKSKAYGILTEVPETEGKAYGTLAEAPETEGKAYGTLAEVSETEGKAYITLIEVSECKSFNFKTVCLSLYLTLILNTSSCKLIEATKKYT